MGVVRFRLPDDVERRLRAMGVSPGARAKELLERDIRREDFRASRRWLARHAVTPKEPISKLIREMRGHS